MNLKSSKYLYKQLSDMEKDNKKEKHVELISEDAFLKLSNPEQLIYTFWYRDTQTFFINNKGEQEIEYIELPDIDLHDQDLSKLRLSRFIPATLDENGNFKLSNINLENSNAEINLSKLYPTKIIFNELKVPRYVIDFSSVNFKGCNLFGMLPDEYLPEDRGKESLKERIIILGKENLDEKYLTRRKEKHLSPQDKKKSDELYQELMDGKYVSSSKFKKRPILVDYDLSEASEITQKNIGYLARDVDFSFTGLPGEVLGYETFKGQSNNVKTEIIKQKILDKDFEFIKNHFNSLDNNFAKKLSEYLLALGSTINIKISSEQAKTINEIICMQADKLTHEDFYNFFITASSYKNYSFMQKYMDKFDQVTKMKAYQNRGFLTTFDMAKEFIETINSKSILQIEIDAAEKTLNSISFKNADAKLQQLLMSYKIRTHDFDYVEDNIDFIKKTRGQYFLTNRYTLDLSNVNRVIKLLIAERDNPKANLSEDEKEKINSIIMSQYKYLEEPQIGEVLSANDLKTSYSLHMKRIEKSVTSAIVTPEEKSNEEDEYRKEKYLNDYIVNHIDVSSLEDIMLNFGTVFDEDIIKEKYSVISQNNKDVRAFLKERLRMNSDDIEKSVQGLKKYTYYFLPSRKDEFRLSKTNQDLYVLADAFDVFGKARDVFTISDSEPNRERKHYLHTLGYEMVYNRLMFLFDNRKEFNIDMTNPNFVWTLGISSKQFEKRFIRPKYPAESRHIWNTSHDSTQVEFEILENHNYRTPEDYQTIRENLKRVKNTLVQEKNNKQNRGEVRA